MEFFVDFFLLFVVENLGGNTIFDSLEPPFLKKYSKHWVFEDFVFVIVLELPVFLK